MTLLKKEKQEASKQFQHNVELWSKTCPRQAFMLPYVNTSHVKETVTKCGEPNLRVKRGSCSYYVHSPLGAAAQANKWFEHLPIEKIFLVCIYGIGLGYYYDAIAAWLKKDRKRRLVFLEDDLGIIKTLFQTERGTRILHDPQVQLLYFQKVAPEEHIFEGLYWNFAMTRLIVDALASYRHHHKAVLAELRHKIAYDAAMKNALVDEYMRFGANYYINFYRNILMLPESYLGNRFFGKFNGVPAIICGAGPSLAKQLPLLEKLRDKALIFAGGSSLNVLNSSGLQPHFGAGIDPNPAQYMRLSQNQGFEVPFFYRNRMHFDAFKMIHGPRLYITGAGGYDTAEYFEKELGIKEEGIDEGHNVVNFCVAIANQMGCNPILFVGMDLAYTGMSLYSPGVVDDSSVTRSAILDVEHVDDKAIERKDIFGKRTFTLWKWVAEADWLGDYAKENPGLTMINCTEGGLGFPGVPNRTLKDASREMLTVGYELPNRIHGEIQNSTFKGVTLRKVLRTMRKLSSSLHQVQTDLKLLDDEAKRVMTSLKKDGQQPNQSGRAALAETELTEEPAYKHVIEVFNEVYARMLSGDMHELQVSRLSDKQRRIKKLEFILQKFAFLHDVAHVNRELIDMSLKAHRKRQKGKKVTVKVPETMFGTYRINDGHLVIEDPEVGVAFDISFHPAYIPDNPVNGAKLPSGQEVKVYFDKRWKRQACYLEKEGKRDGQAHLYYPNGKLKEEMFYYQGQLHGPSRFWNLKGTLLAESWFVNGCQEGKCLWYYPSKKIYAIQRFKKGKWHGRQEYYYEDGTVKSLIIYKQGKLVGTPILLKPDGSKDR